MNPDRPLPEVKRQDRQQDEDQQPATVLHEIKERIDHRFLNDLLIVAMRGTGRRLRLGREQRHHHGCHHRGGQHRWDNLVAACQQCNRSKGGRSALEANMILRRRPIEPAPTANYLFGRHLADNSGWAKYIDGW